MSRIMRFGYSCDARGCGSKKTLFALEQARADIARVEQEREPFLRFESEICQCCRETARALLQFAVAKRTFRVDESGLFGKTASDRRIDKIRDSVIWLALQQVAQH